MAELHSNIYYQHDNPATMQALDTLFLETRGDEAQIRSIAASLNPQDGAALAQDLIDIVDTPEHDLGAESIRCLAGYSVAHFVHGSAGDEFVEAIVGFLHRLVPGLHVQAWGCGDDDPWEFWFKVEGDEILRQDDEPYSDPEQDEQIRTEIYPWWHAGMPEEIKEGFLNDEDAQDE